MNGEQITIVWHVDDLKISHADSNVVTQYIKKLDDKFRKDAYGTKATLTVCCGKKHDYLGITLDYSTNKKVKIDMTEYTKKF